MTREEKEYGPFKVLSSTPGNWEVSSEKYSSMTGSGKNFEEAKEDLVFRIDLMLVD